MVTILSLTVLCSVSTVGLPQVITIDKVLVIVNDDPITMSEYQARYRREVLENNLIGKINNHNVIDPRILELLVDERVQTITAARRGIHVSDEQIKDAIRTIANRNDLSISELEDMLSSNGITSAQFRESIKEQQLIRHLVDVAVNSRVKVSEQEIELFLNAHKALNVSNNAFEISHLSISTVGKSEEKISSELGRLELIRSGIIQGQSFSNAVYLYSDTNKDDGGYLGWRKENQLPTIFIQALQETVLGGVSEIIKSMNGLHLLKLHDKEGGGEFVKQQRIRHILIDPHRKNLTAQESLEFALNIFYQLQEGKNFESLARLHSDDNLSNDNGGLIGWISPGDMTSNIEETASKMAIGEVSLPLKSPFGFHIIQVLERREHDISHDIKRRHARRVIFERKAVALYRNWLDSLKNAAYIEYIVSVGNS